MARTPKKLGVAPSLTLYLPLTSALLNMSLPAGDLTLDPRCTSSPSSLFARPTAKAGAGEAIVGRWRRVRPGDSSSKQLTLPALAALLEGEQLVFDVEPASVDCLVLFDEDQVPCGYRLCDDGLLRNDCAGQASSETESYSKPENNADGELPFLLRHSFFLKHTRQRVFSLARFYALPNPSPQHKVAQVLIVALSLAQTYLLLHYLELEPTLLGSVISSYMGRFKLDSIVSPRFITWLSSGNILGIKQNLRLTKKLGSEVSAIFSAYSSFSFSLLSSVPSALRPLLSVPPPLLHVLLVLLSLPLRPLSSPLSLLLDVVSFLCLPLRCAHFVFATALSRSLSLLRLLSRLNGGVASLGSGGPAGTKSNPLKNREDTYTPIPSAGLSSPPSFSALSSPYLELLLTSILSLVLLFLLTTLWTWAAAVSAIDFALPTAMQLAAATVARLADAMLPATEPEIVAGGEGGERNFQGAGMGHAVRFRRIAGAKAKPETLQKKGKVALFVMELRFENASRRRVISGLGFYFKDILVVGLEAVFNDLLRGEWGGGILHQIISKLLTANR